MPGVGPGWAAVRAEGWREVGASAKAHKIKPAALSAARPNESHQRFLLVLIENVDACAAALNVVWLPEKGCLLTGN